MLLLIFSAFAQRQTLTTFSTGLSFFSSISISTRGTPRWSPVTSTFDRGSRCQPGTHSYASKCFKLCFSRLSKFKAYAITILHFSVPSEFLSVYFDRVSLKQGNSLISL